MCNVVNFVSKMLSLLSVFVFKCASYISNEIVSTKTSRTEDCYKMWNRLHRESKSIAGVKCTGYREKTFRPFELRVGNDVAICSHTTQIQYNLFSWKILIFNNTRYKIFSRWLSRFYFFVFLDFFKYCIN